MAGLGGDGAKLTAGTGVLLPDPVSCLRTQTFAFSVRQKKSTMCNIFCFVMRVVCIMDPSGKSAPTPTEEGDGRLLRGNSGILDEGELWAVYQTGAMLPLSGFRP